jgi:hypothetical protein
MSRLYRVKLPLLLLAAALLPGTAGAQRTDDPLRFFEGRTESVSMIDTIARKPYRSRSLGRGEIRPDGSLRLVQRVEEDGRPAFDRLWLIRQVSPGHFSGTMTDAKGPVTVDQVAGRFRFRFKMKGNLSIEQWLTPLADGKSAKSKITIRKLGLTVGSSEGIIRKY